MAHHVSLRDFGNPLAGWPLGRDNPAMTKEITFHPNPGAEVVLTHSPLVRAFRTIAAYQAEHGAIGLTKSGAWNRHAVDWVVRRWEFPNWTAEKLYTVNKVLNEFDVPPLEYLRVLLSTLRLGRKAKGGWGLTMSGQKLAGDPEAAFVTLTPAFLFRFDHAEDMRAGTVPAGDWALWLHAIARMPADGFSLTDLAALLYGRPPFRDGVAQWAACSARWRCRSNGRGC
jgi:hypothetical protein